MKILVTGATGHLGGVVLDTLLKRGIPANQIATLTRKPDKQTELKSRGFNSCLGSYDDVASLEKATADVDTVLLVSSGDQGDRMREHKNVVDAAKKQGVTCVAYTGRSLRDPGTLANDLMEEHFETEDYIKASGLKYTIFRNALYMDVVPIFVGQDRVFQAGIVQPAGDGKVSYALRAEQAEAIANVLAREACANKTYQFTGNEAYSFSDVAKALSELSGKEVKYTSVEAAKFRETMVGRGVPEHQVQKIIAFNTDIEDGQESEVTHELEQALGRRPTPLKEGLKGLFKL